MKTSKNCKKFKCLCFTMSLNFPWFWEFTVIWQEKVHQKIPLSKHLIYLHSFTVQQTILIFITIIPKQTTNLNSSFLFPHSLLLFVQIVHLEKIMHAWKSKWVKYDSNQEIWMVYIYITISPWSDTCWYKCKLCSLYNFALRIDRVGKPFFQSSLFWKWKFPECYLIWEFEAFRLKL